MTVLVVAPHADDEVLGMGGTIAKYCEENEKVVVAVMTGHGDAPHPLWPKENWDVVREECLVAAKVLGNVEIRFFDLPAACLDITPAWKINKVIVDLIKETDPSIIYVPFAYDLHKDHAAIAYAVSVAARPYLPAAKNVVRVLAYETLSETHLAPPYSASSFQPNVFNNISFFLNKKLNAMSAYKSQLQPDGSPRSLATIEALARLRGAHVGVQAAEAFVLLGEYNR
jgi:LmbE family N-acetylglucosaminyl deacetylase